MFGKRDKENWIDFIIYSVLYFAGHLIISLAFQGLFNQSIMCQRFVSLNRGYNKFINFINIMVAVAFEPLPRGIIHFC